MGTITSTGTTTVTANYGRFRRRVAMGAAAVLIAVGGVVTGVVVTTHDDAPAAATVDVPEAQLPQLGEADPVLAGLSAEAPIPSDAVLGEQLDALLADAALGAGVSASVVDVATGTEVYTRDAAEPASPASTAKLLTAAAALTTLDPAATIPTTVVAGSTPGEVVLVGGGDPTLSRTAPSQTYPGAPTVADLATQVVTALPAGTEVTRVVVDGSLYTGPLTASGWGPGDSPSNYAAPVTATAVDGARVAPGALARSAQPGLDAGAALADALGVVGATVVLGEAPEGGPTLATVQSAPVVRLVEQMLSLSDNMLAESLARQVAMARGLPASFEGAAQAVTEAVTEALGEALADPDVDLSRITLADGSGLSGQNAVPAGVLTALLRGAADGSLDDAGAILSGLPVAGYDGTLAERGDEDPATAPGAVRAKTGTLLGVHALAGTVVTADGRLLAFALMADGVTGGQVAAEAALDAAAAQLARCGCG